jgi:hypothetical protein
MKAHMKYNEAGRSDARTGTQRRRRPAALARPCVHRLCSPCSLPLVRAYVSLLLSFMRLYIQASPVLCADVEQRLRVDDAVVKTLTIKHKIAAPVVVEKRVHNMKVTRTNR